MDATTIERKTCSGRYAAVRRTCAMVFRLVDNSLSFCLPLWPSSLWSLLAALASATIVKPSRLLSSLKTHAIVVFRVKKSIQAWKERISCT